MPLAELAAEWVMWSGTLGRPPVEDRADAARAAGYDLLSVGAAEALDWAASGVRLSSVAARVADGGVALHSLDAVVSWTGVDGDPGLVGRLLDTAGELGVASITAVTAEPPGTETARLLPGFARLCAEATGRGLGVDLEFVPMSAVGDLATATDLLEEVGLPGVGLVLDTWHFFRGPAPDAGAVVRAARLIRQVQLSDATWEVRGSLLRDTLTNRRVPGSGEFPLEPLLRLLHEHGALRGIGPEVLSSDLHALGPTRAAVAAGTAVDQVLARALGTPGPLPGG